nr:hypothetical protein BaRGS_032925 [Batillaria attramentaria]
MLISAWWLFSIVIGATYSGNLIAFLTVQIEDKPFETLAELLDQDTYSWGSLGKTSTTMLLMESKNPVLKGLGDGIRERRASDPSVLDLDYQVHHDKVRVWWICLHHGLDIRLTPGFVTSVTLPWIEGDGVSMPVDPYAVYLPRHSSFTRLFNEYVMRIVEAGLIEKWKRDWWTDSLRCAKSIVTESEPIYVHDVQSVLYAGLVGFGLALLSLGCEFLVHKHPKLRAWAKKLAESCSEECTENPEMTRRRRRHGRGGDNSDNNNEDNHQNHYLEDMSPREGSHTPEVIVDQHGGGAHPGHTDLSAFDFSRARTFKFTYNTAHMYSPTFSSPEDFRRDERRRKRSMSPNDGTRSMSVRIAENVRIAN